MFSNKSAMVATINYFFLGGWGGGGDFDMNKTGFEFSQLISGGVAENLE